MRSFTVAEIAAFLQGQVIGDGSVTLTGFAPAETARAGDLTFAENALYFERAQQSAATAILIDGSFASSEKALIRVAKARIAFAKVLPLFFPKRTFQAGIHPSAVIDASARIDPTAHIGPLCVVAENVTIGAETVLESGDHIGAHSHLGAGCHLFPNVSIYPDTEIGDRVAIHSGTVIGADGFGYVFDQGEHRKVPQVGNVVIGSDVEIGANVTIDRGALGSTIIGAGTKIDNLVQIAHNVHLGKHCIMVAQGGIAGSAKVGNYVVMGGQVAIIGHIQIGDRATIAARSGVMEDIPAGAKVFGLPARPARQTHRQMIAIEQLPEMLRRLRRIEKELKLRPGPDEPGSPGIQAGD